MIKTIVGLDILIYNSMQNVINKYNDKKKSKVASEIEIDYLKLIIANYSDFQLNRIFIYFCSLIKTNRFDSAMSYEQ